MQLPDKICNLKLFLLNAFFVTVIGMEPNTGNGEDLMTLEAEISELQRENARVESQMLKLKSDINAMESHLSQGDKVSIKVVIFHHEALLSFTLNI